VGPTEAALEKYVRGVKPGPAIPIQAAVGVNRPPIYARQELRLSAALATSGQKPSLSSSLGPLICPNWCPCRKPRKRQSGPVEPRMIGIEVGGSRRRRGPAPRARRNLSDQRAGEMSFVGCVSKSASNSTSGLGLTNSTRTVGVLFAPSLALICKLTGGLP
jgi:hypothetical protein